MYMKTIYNEVYNCLKNDKSGHGMDHIDRVVDLSLKFCELENANKNIVTLIALLHDVDDYKLVGKEQANELTNAKNIMNECSIDSNIQEIVCNEIKRIGYSKSLKGVRPLTIEGKIVSDADMCDAIGAHGILRCYTYSMKINQPFFNPNVFPIEDISQEKYTTYDSTSVNHMFEKLLKLKDLMLTNAGKEESKRRHEIIVEFLKHYFEEENAIEWLQLLENKKV